MVWVSSFSPEERAERHAWATASPQKHAGRAGQGRVERTSRDSCLQSRTGMNRCSTRSTTRLDENYSTNRFPLTLGERPALVDAGADNWCAGDNEHRQDVASQLAEAQRWDVVHWQGSQWCMCLRQNACSRDAKVYGTAPRTGLCMAL